MGFAGAALLGLSTGYKEAQIASEDRQYELARRAYLLKGADTNSQSADIDLAQKKLEWETQQVVTNQLATSLRGMGTDPAQQQAQMPAMPQVQPQGAQPQPQGSPQPTQPGAAALGPGFQVASPSSGNWDTINAQVRANQPQADQARLITLKQELAQNTQLLSHPDPSIRAEAQQNVDALRKEAATVLTKNATDKADAAFDQSEAPLKAADATAKAAVDAGAPAPVQAQASLYDKQAALMNKAASDVLQNPSVSPEVRTRAAMIFQQRAQDYSKKALDFKKEQLATMKLQLESVGQAYAPLGDPKKATQEDLNNLVKLNKGNDSFAQTWEQLGMTGLIDQDRNKLAMLTHVGETANQADRARLEAMFNAIRTQSADTAARREDRLAGTEDRIASKGKAPTLSSQFASPDTPTPDPKSPDYVPPPVGTATGASIKRAAELALLGDTSQQVGLTRGRDGLAIKAAINNEIARQTEGKTSQEVLGGMQEGKATNRARQELGAREGKIASAVEEARGIAGLALQGNSDYSRTDFQTLNKMIQAGQTETSDPKLRQFIVRHNSLINAYARAINPTGVATVSDKDHAREMLPIAAGPTAYAAGVNTMLQEIDQAQAAPREAMRKLRTGESTSLSKPTGAKFLGFE